MKQISIGFELATILSLVLASVGLSAAGVQAAGPSRTGAPALTAPAPQIEAAPSTQLRSIHFSLGEAILRAQAQAALKSDAVWITANPDYRIVIAGFADARGGKEYNLALAHRRAESVRDYLVGHGIRAERVEIVSYGVTNPRCTQPTEPCWARNRRVELFVKPMPPEAS